MSVGSDIATSLVNSADHKSPFNSQLIAIISVTLGMGKALPTVVLLSFRKSITTVYFLFPNASSFFGTTNSCVFHGLLLCVIMPSRFISSTCLAIFPYWEYGSL
jgi:hypothetical protein